MSDRMSSCPSAVAGRVFTPAAAGTGFADTASAATRPIITRKDVSSRGSSRDTGIAPRTGAVVARRDRAVVAETAIHRGRRRLFRDTDLNRRRIEDLADGIACARHMMLNTMVASVVPDELGIGRM